MNCYTFLENKAIAQRKKTLFIDLDFLNSFFARLCINTRKLFLLFLICITFCPSIIVAQSYNFCGVFPAHEATTSNPDSILYDRFGNSYDVAYFQETGGSRSICGYFDLEFHGIPDSIKGTICEVFSDISSIIQLRNNITPCGGEAISGNVKIKVSYDETISYPVLASGSPNYSLDIKESCDETQINRVYSKINGGKKFDLYGIDGELHLNHQDTFRHTNHQLDTLIWHIDSNSNPTEKEFDLYSVILHEALHIIGFESRIKSNGKADLGFFSLWDNLIYTTPEYNPNLAEPEFHRLLVSDCSNNCWSLNDTTFSKVEDFVAASNLNCSESGSIDFVIGLGIAPLVGGSPNQNAFSHLRDSCNDQYTNYVMQPGIKRGPESNRRIITEAERTILCKLGYKLEDCEGCFMTSSKEQVQTGIDYYNTCCNPIFNGCVGDTLIVKYSDLLCNDFTNGSEIQISTWSESSSNFSVVSNDTAFLIYSTVQNSYPVNYTIKGCDCRLLSSIFYVYFLPCVDCSLINPCNNLVCTNGFEEYTSNANQVGIVTELVNGSYWVHNYSQENTPDMCRVNNNSYLTIVGSEGNPEGVAFKLSESVPADCTLKINLDASFGASPSYLTIHGSKYPPCSFLDSRISNDCMPTDCGDYVYAPVCIDTVHVDNGASQDDTSCPYAVNLQPVTEVEWMNDTHDSINYIIISAEIPEGSSSRNIYIDNVVITYSCSDASFSYNYVDDCNEIELIPTQEGINISHFWYFGDGDTTSLSSPNHIYTSIDTFTVTHIIDDACGNRDTVLLNVIINGQGTNCCPDTTISTTTTWSGNPPHQGRFHNITVEKGVAFTIDDNVTLEFCEGGALIIEAGAYVDLEGGLTSYGDMQWKGVFVSGDSSLSQATDIHSGGFNGQQQGFLQTRSGSSIKNAEIGIRNYGKAGSSSSGGMIRCVGTIFQNNTIGVDFIEYQNFNDSTNQPLLSLGSFNGCRFLTDANYNLHNPFYCFARIYNIDGIDFKACKFVNTFLPQLPSQVEDFGFGILAIDANFGVHPDMYTGGIGPCPPPCILTDSTLFQGLGHGIYVMTKMQSRPYSVYHSLFENCCRGLTDMTRGGGTILFNIFLLGEVPDQEFSIGQIGVEFHTPHDGFTLQENLFIVQNEETEIIPIGVLCGDLGEFDNEIRRNTFVGVETENQAYGENADTSIIFPRGLRYFCNTFKNTPSQGYDFHIPNTSALDLIHPFQTPGSSHGLNISAGNHFSYTAQDFMNYGEATINYWHYPPGQNEEPRDSFSINISDFEGSANDCSTDYCAPPCIEVVEDVKDDFINHLDSFNINLDNYLNALISENQLQIDTSRSKALYYRRLSSRDAYIVLQHLMIDTLDYNKDTLIMWMEHLDTYGSEIMIAGEYASAGDFENAINVLETLAIRHDISQAQSVDLSYLLDIYYLLDEKPILSFSQADRSYLRNIAYLNTGAASGVSRAILSSFGEYIPLPYYHGEQINFRNATQDSTFTFFSATNHIPFKIYPNPTSGDIMIEWEDQGFICVKLFVYNLFGEKEFEVKGVPKSPYHLDTSPFVNGMHWVIAMDNSGKTISGKFIKQKN